ncbi:type II toxin-antitoxin system HicA family toxin [Desulforamulus aquiferis]|uniref:Type II toxin-antitoxin system HicA family toxin n=1 Tax=Desulforamulus aquiferis TaxID=1397668 RepID=A0AAW7ZG47_9FIRM|nr:type II toxin-antitoxin system HicA family toxin [Desulforamulus aquiferis]
MKKKCYSSTELLKILKKEGWIIKGQEGSHIHLIHPTKLGKVTVPHPRKDFKQTTLRSILKQAGLELK